MINTLQVDGLARIPGYDTYHTCRILSHRTASPHALYDVLVLDGGRGKTMNDLVDERSRTARQQSNTKQSIATHGYIHARIHKSTKQLYKSGPRNTCHARPGKYNISGVGFICLLPMSLCHSHPYINKFTIDHCPCYTNKARVTYVMLARASTTSLRCAPRT